MNDRTTDEQQPERGLYEDKFEYPPTLADLKEERRTYCDEAAAAMFVKAGGRKLQASATTMSSALVRQAEKLEQFNSTPFTDQNIATIRLTLDALERTQSALREWHWLIYPNQRPSGDKVPPVTAAMQNAGLR